MKPSRPGWYWRRFGRHWQPVRVARTSGFNGERRELLWQPIGSPFAYDVRNDGKWGERCARSKVTP